MIMFRDMNLTVYLLELIFKVSHYQLLYSLTVLNSFYILIYNKMSSLINDYINMKPEEVKEAVDTTKNIFNQGKGIVNSTGTLIDDLVPKANEKYAGKSDKDIKNMYK